MDKVYSLHRYEEIDVIAESIICEVHGCIPASIQWLLEWSELSGHIKTGIDFNDFQEDICKKFPKENRGFPNIIEYIANKYNQTLGKIKLRSQNFKTGADKFKTICDFLKEQRCILISIPSFLERRKPNSSYVRETYFISLYDQKQSVLALEQKVEDFFEKKNAAQVKPSSKIENSIIRGFHIIPVIRCSESRLTVKDIADNKEKEFTRKHLEYLHDEEKIIGGKDLLWLEY